MRIMPVAKEAPKKLSKIQRTLWNLREDMKVCNIYGDHAKYVEAKIAFMKTFVENPREGLTLPPTSSISVPLFSKVGLNMYKILFGEFFRKRTPEEKELAKKMQDIRLHKHWYV